MTEKLYAFTREDFDRMAAAVRRVERMVDVHLQRRQAIHTGMGEGEDFPLPDSRLALPLSGVVNLSKDTHSRKWLWTYSYSGVLHIYLPDAPTEGDPYYLHGPNNESYYETYVYPHTNQTIIMPSGIVSVGYRVRFGYGTLSYGDHNLTLFCCKPNTWVAWPTTTSVIEPVP